MFDDVVDARHERSRNSLYAAILELCATAPLSSITATEIAQHAGVGRATFYRHTKSPEGLLLDALRSELDEIRETALARVADATATESVSLGPVLVQVVETVARRENIYGPALLSDGSPVVAKMLIDHVHESVWRYYRTTGSRLAEEIALPGIDREFATDAAASGFAHLFVGVLTSWMRRSEGLDAHEFLLVFDALAPRWWLSVSGETS